jgi:DNA cross-link repair 1A protein
MNENNILSAIDDIPRYRRVPNTNFLVDFFQKEVPHCTHYFLTHFHSDHYAGLGKSFSSTVYCSETTANLVVKKQRVKRENVFVMKMHVKYELSPDSYVTCIDAYHCPGAVSLLFEVGGVFYLHTGDFRASEEFLSQDMLLKRTYNTVYLDNTYERTRDFPSQEETIRQIIQIILERTNSKGVLFPIKHYFVFGAYTIGKEKIFMSVASYFNFDILIDKGRMDVINCFSQYTRESLEMEVKKIVSRCGGIPGEKSVFESLTTVPGPNQIRVISQSHMTGTKLNELFKNMEGHSRIVAFCGTGWKKGTSRLAWNKADGRVIRNGIEINYIPYSEHSSDTELAEFKKRVVCNKITNTVNGL